MKARVKATGEIVDVHDCGSVFYHGRMVHGYASDGGNKYLPEWLEFEWEDECAPDYWEKLKHQYAGMAMQGLVTRGEVLGSSVQEIARDIAEISCEVAHALVEKLKEKEE